MRVVRFVVWGGLIYWSADFMVQLVVDGKAWIPLLTIAVPAVASMGYFILRRRQLERSPSLALFMLLGIWMFGPLGVGLASQAKGGTFLNAGNISDFLMLWAMFPITTIMMSTYSGSLGGVYLATILFVIYAVVDGTWCRTQKTKLNLDAQKQNAE